MTENHLLRTLRLWLAEEVKGFRLPDTSGEEKPVQIINGWLPPKRGAAGEDWPFIVVRPVSGACDDGRNSVTVQLACGVLTDGTQDEHERLINLVRHTLNALAGLPDAMLEHRYQLESPITWEISDEQPYPAWLAVITTVWDFAGITAPHEMEAKTFGYFD